MKLTAKYTLTMLTLLAASFASHADGYKMVVINEDILAPLASQTTAEQGLDLKNIQQLAGQKTQDAFSRQMNLCVAHTRAGDANAADICHQAVMQSTYSAGRRSGQQKTLRAYAYSNRGVAKVQRHDKVGALADFQTAVALVPDDINQHNLMKLVNDINQTQALQVALD